MQYGERVDKAYFADVGFTDYQTMLIKRNKNWYESSLKNGERLSAHVCRAYIVHGDSMGEIAMRYQIRTGRVSNELRRGLDYYNEVNKKEQKQRSTIRGFGERGELNV